MIKKTYMTMAGDEFNDLVRKKVSRITNNANRYKDWESVAEFEWNNDCVYACEVKPTDQESDYYLKYTHADILAGEKLQFICSFHGMLTFMMHYNILEAGNYLVNPSW